MHSSLLLSVNPVTRAVQCVNKYAEVSARVGLYSQALLCMCSAADDKGNHAINV